MVLNKWVSPVQGNESHGSSGAAQLLAAVRKQASVDFETTGDARVERVIELIDEVEVRQVADECIQPVVTNWLDRAVDNAPADTRGLAETLRDHHADVPWKLAYETVTGNEYVDQMRSGYAFALIAGIARDDFPTGPFASDRLLLGFSLQAPRIHYPEHFHEAVEIYSVISGNADWLNGDRVWTPRTPGSVMIHDHNEVHGMHTHDEPLLTWVAWITDPECAAILE